MQNIIAVIWDFDKTLIDGNMQDPIFEEYHIDKAKFWQHVNALPAHYAKEGVKVNADTIYLNQFIKDAQNGIFKGLNNEKLKTFGQKQKYYHGVPEIFKNLQRVVEENPKYREYNIKVEHYIVSTGMSAIIKGSAVMPYVEAIWGCDLIEGLDAEKHKIISEVGYTIDNTTKTRALFEINKGVPQHPEIDVNAKMSDALRRVAFPNNDLYCQRAQRCAGLFGSQKIRRIDLCHLSQRKQQGFPPGRTTAGRWPYRYVCRSRLP